MTKSKGNVSCPIEQYKQTPGAQTRRTRMKFALATAMACAGITAAAAPLDPSPFHPPWTHNGGNNPVKAHGLEFTVPEIDNLPDFHGNPLDAKLNLFVGGNYFFAMAPLVAEFVHQHPEFDGRIYYETIPPGLLVDQIHNGGTITVGNMTWTVHADVYAGGLKRAQQLVEEGRSKGDAVPYATNTLTIMVPKGNPGQVKALSDLARPGLQLVMPNPAYEGIGRQIKSALAKDGGEALVKAVYETKVANGESSLTRIHHRQSPLWLMLGRAQAGVTWQSEAIFQEEAGNPISHVAIPDANNVTATYAAVALKDAPHPEAARLWVEYLRSPAALKIFMHYGFKPYLDGAVHPGEATAK
jgi:ABC-type molybdate transport system substrate-binding protein